MEVFDPVKFPALSNVAKAVLQVWPEHSSFIGKSFPAGDASPLLHGERIASMIVRLSGDNLIELARDYRWTCERLLEEELYFRRNGAYRLKTVSDASHEVYQNTKFMGRYVNGLLLSQLFWSNHRGVFNAFTDSFLPQLPPSFRHLEIGPGHGLYLALAAEHDDCLKAVGWDISETSASQTLKSLDRMGLRSPIAVELRDIMNKPTVDEKADGQFDSVVISEVLEHLEEPERALKNLREVMAPDSKIFVNMPVNSPAPDHIYLLRNPKEVVDLVVRSGFIAVEKHLFPATGYSEQRALKHAATISCVVIATPDT